MLVTPPAHRLGPPHQGQAPVRRRGMSRMRAFHDSMGLFVGGIGVAHPSGGSTNVNRCPSRMRLRIIRRALAGRRCWSATVPSSRWLFWSRNSLWSCSHWLYDAGHSAAGSASGTRGKGDGGLPRALARFETRPEAGRFGDVHARVEQATLHACRGPDRAQRLGHAASAVAHHGRRRRDPQQRRRPCGAGLASGRVPPDDMAVGDRDGHDRLPMQVDAVDVHHVMRRPVQRHRRP